MLGFVLPLYIIVGVETFLAFNLMLPLPLCMPAVKLCRFFKCNTVARTFINTSAGFLTVLLLSPLYDTWAMHRAKADASHATPESLVETTSGEATAQLSACLTAASIGNLFMLRHLGATIDERETLKAQLLEHNIEPNVDGKLGLTAADKVDVPLKAE